MTFSKGDRVLAEMDSAWHEGVVSRVLEDHYWVKFPGTRYESEYAYGRPDRINGAERFIRRPSAEDAVNHPSHYKWLPVEVIEITEHLNFCLGNAVKYILRCDHKGKPVEDLKKARWYIDRELQRREGAD